MATTLHADDYAYMPPDTPHRFALVQRNARCYSNILYYSLNTLFDHLLMWFRHQCVVLAVVAGTCMS